MRYSLLLIALTTLPAVAVAAPPAKKTTVVRPVLWWSDLGRVSDGGGPSMKAKTELISDQKRFAKVWSRLGQKRKAAVVNFKDYIVVNAFRHSRVEFHFGSGLSVDTKGHAKVAGVTIPYPATSAGWYSTTLAVFPRKGIVSIDGQKLPAVK